MKIGIIGAGLAGLTAARALQAAGRDVTLFEKSGGLGGRVATRRAGGAAFDHGAPLLHGFEPPDAAGAIRWRDGWIGVPGNSAIGRGLGAGLAIRGGVRVEGLERVAGRWRLRTAAGDAAAFDVALLAIPSPQAIGLLGDVAGTCAGLEAVTMRPGWTAMALFDAPVAGPDWRDDPGEPLGRVIRNAAKPERPAGEAWVIHASDRFACDALERDGAEVAALLVAAFRDATGAPAPVLAVAHRWRYARVERPLGAACLWDAGAGLGLAGDWCLGADAGDAAASGAALAQAVAGA